VGFLGTAETAVFLQLQPIRVVLLVFVGDVVAALAPGAGQRYDDAHLASFPSSNPRQRLKEKSRFSKEKYHNQGTAVKSGRLPDGLFWAKIYFKLCEA
jgi:hypothetical protein